MPAKKNESYPPQTDNPQRKPTMISIPEPSKKSIVFDRIVDIAIIVIAVAMVLELILWR